MPRSRPWARVLAGLQVLAFGAGLTAAPAAAAETQAKAPATSPAPRPIAASVAAAVAAAPSPSSDPAVLKQEQPTPAADSPSFFRSPKGIAALVLFVGGVAFTFHSMDKDRIHSPVR